MPVNVFSRQYLHSQVGFLGEMTAMFEKDAPHLQDQGINTNGPGKETEVNWMEFVRTQLIAVTFGEYLASIAVGFIIIMTFSSAGAVTGVAYNATTLGLGIGLAVYVGVILMGHISGGHANPSISLLLYLMHVFHYWKHGSWRNLIMRTVLLSFMITAQFAGWLTAAGFAYYAIRESKTNTDLGIPTINSAGINGRIIKRGPAFFTELVASTIFLGVYAFSVVDRKSKHAAQELGLTVAALTMALAGTTGASMNPMRWIGTSIVENQYNKDWPSFIFPSLIAVLPALAAVELWRRGIETIGVGRDNTMMSAPQMPPHNKYMESLKEKKQKKGMAVSISYNQDEKKK